MASSLAETIASNFLNCPICFETYRDPRALPCQHGFCRECLEQCLGSSEDKRTLMCPVCREEVKLSKEGVNKLPVHFLVSSLQDTVVGDMEKTKTKSPSHDTACSNCNTPGNNKATVRCVDCRDYLCESCYKSHKILKAMKDHKIISMEDILSGNVNLTKEEENRFCKTHGKLCEYYCETEKKSLCRDCVILNDCPYDHSRISLKKAAQIYTDELNDLLQSSYDTLEKYKEAMMATNRVRKELKINSQLGKKAVDKAENNYIDKVKKMFQRFKDDLESIRIERIAELDQVETNLQSYITENELVTEQTETFIQTESEFEIVSAHSSLSSQLQQLSITRPTAADPILSFVKFEAEAFPTVSPVGQLFEEGVAEERWTLIREFSTGELDQLLGLALDKDDNVALCSWDKGVKVFKVDGSVKCSLYDSPGGVDIAVSPDNTFYSIRNDKCEIQTSDSNGAKLGTIQITDVNNEPSYVNSLTVDSSGKIVVGQVRNTISIHNADGSEISKFAIHNTPYALTATSNGEIVCSIYDDELECATSVQLMDYSGGNVRVIQPPVDAKLWHPGFVCCGLGEIFISNESSGDPSGVYRYTTEGDYLGCVTLEIRNPTGIALSSDGMNLFVADYVDKQVKIFKRT